MNQNVAGTDLSLSAVHAIIEIGRAKGLSSKDLGEKLLLEKSTVSRIVKNLVKRGKIREVRSKDDLRVKHLHLTRQGIKTLHAIDAFAEEQVSGALSKLDDRSQQCVLKGLQDYSAALKNASTRHGDISSYERVKIKTGYVPTIIGRIIEMLQSHMNKHYSFDSGFESRIAGDLADFISRIDSPQSEIWRAETGGRIIGSISIDGDDLDDGLAHLRWFVVSEEIRGEGVGNSLLSRAIDFCDECRFSEIHLWTVKGLDAARKLYESHGFELVEEYYGDQWGAEVIEHKFARHRPQRIN
jgi:DNA-binding MarR family transcriptional regulator/GNAT superfamily N-acetyltransferase